MSKTSKIIYFLVSLFFFIFFDLFSSNYIINNQLKIPQNPLIDLFPIENTGAAFSILQDARWFLIVFSTVAALLIISYVFRKLRDLSPFSLFWTSLLVAGIFCNLYERITLGYVQDFFKLTFINFPVFNISDIFINISVFAIVIIIIKQNFSKNNETGN